MGLVRPGPVRPTWSLSLVQKEPGLTIWIQINRRRRRLLLLLLCRILQAFIFRRTKAKKLHLSRNWGIFITFLFVFFNLYFYSSCVRIHSRIILTMGIEILQLFPFFQIFTWLIYSWFSIEFLLVFFPDGFFIFVGN